MTSLKFPRFSAAKLETRYLVSYFFKRLLNELERDQENQRANEQDSARDSADQKASLQANELNGLRRRKRADDEGRAADHQSADG